MCAAIGGDDCEAVEFLDAKIAEQGRDQRVIADETQMMLLLGPMMSKVTLIGSLLIYRPTYSEPLIEGVRSAPARAAEQLHDLVHGYIKLIPHFNAIIHKGTKRACAAFCNEHGKINGLIINVPADAPWHVALERTIGAVVPFDDYLVGTIVVIIGDKELMRNL